MKEILEEFNDKHIDITSYSANRFYSTEEDPGILQCFANLSNSKMDFLDFIEQHDCFLNLSDI